MTDFFSRPLAEPVGPDYVIHQFTDGIYKVVNFKRPAPRFSPPVRTSEPKNDNKLIQSLSRARRTVLELALCNDWAYFCTFTLDGTKYKRDGLPKFHKDFTQWVRDQRKKYIAAGYDFPIRFLFVPEEHQDGAWHMHGLLSDISPVLISFRELRDRGERVPDKLVDGGYSNWLDYQKKFGFCSLGKIRSQVATGFYITKYVTKQMDECTLPVGAHSYYPSRPLNRSVKHGEIYGYCAALDKYLDHDYEFCKTGFTHVRDGLSWDFALEYMNDYIEPLDLSYTEEVEKEVDRYWEITQSAIAGFLEDTYVL